MLQAGQTEPSYDGADFDKKAIDDFEAKLGLYLEQGQSRGLVGA